MGVRLSGLPSAIKRAYPAANRRGSVVETAAVLDVAFDHLLYGLHERGVYGAIDLTLKGGTALRKIAEIKAGFRNERSRGSDQAGYPSPGW